MDQEFSLRWNNYLNQITDAFGSLKNDEDLVDVTLSCEGRTLKAHKMLLSACSPYFKEVFKENPCQHPVIVFRDFKFVDLEAIIDFMYKGEVDVKQEHFETFLGTAEILEVKGLTEGSRNTNVETDESHASKVLSTGTEKSERLHSRRQPDSVAVSTEGSSSSNLSKKRKNSAVTDKVKHSEKKQKSVVVPSSIIPKIKKEEIVSEDLTFDDEDPDDSLPTRTDPSVDYNTDHVPGYQDLSQLTKTLHVPDKIPPTKKRTKPTRVCKYCTDRSKRETGKAVRKETSWWCEYCAVPLCITGCFRKYHGYH